MSRAIRSCQSGKEDDVVSLVVDVLKMPRRVVGFWSSGSHVTPLDA